MILFRIVSGVWPSAWASKLRMMRWRSTAGRDGSNVIDAEMDAAAHQREHASAFHQRLRAARRAAVADVLLRELVRAG